MCGEEETLNFKQPHFPIGGQTQVDGLNDFYHEIGVRILFIDVTRRIAEQSDKVALRRHT